MCFRLKLNLKFISFFSDTALLSNMNLDNLFNPDYNYDYDALNAEGEENGEKMKGELTKEEQMKQEQINSMGTIQEKPAEMIHNVMMNELEQSSYTHYPGQRMAFPPNRRHYHHFKINRPNKHG